MKLSKDALQRGFPTLLTLNDSTSPETLTLVDLFLESQKIWIKHHPPLFDNHEILQIFETQDWIGIRINLEALTRSLDLRKQAQIGNLLEDGPRYLCLLQLVSLGHRVSFLFLDPLE